MRRGRFESGMGKVVAKVFAGAAHQAGNLGSLALRNGPPAW